MVWKLRLSNATIQQIGRQKQRPGTWGHVVRDIAFSKGQVNLHPLGSF